MTRENEDQGPAGRFLLADAAVDSHDESNRPARISMEILEAEFPGLIAEGELLRQILERLQEGERFGALLLQIDSLAEQGDPHEPLIALMHAGNALSMRKSGLWSLVDGFRIGLVLPGADPSDCLDSAGRIQDRFFRKTGFSATAGAACHPTLSYPPSAIFENARKALVHAEFFGPGSRVAFDSVSLNISGDQYYQKGEIEKAVSEFQSAISLDPENVNVQNSLGVCHGVSGALDEALSCFETAIRLDPSEVMPVYNAGYVHVLKADYTRALEYFRRAEEINPEVFELAFQTGRVHLVMQDPQKALSYLETAARLNPDSNPAHRLLGDACHQLERLDDAERAYKRALKLNPEDAAALSALGLIYETLGQNADIALVFCRQSCEIAPANGLFRHRLAQIHLNRGHFEDAVREFQRATELGCDSSAQIEEIQQERKTARQG
jgi:tetratricopeptide (TPR) repeat protein